jgi:hypothetical protein
MFYQKKLFEIVRWRYEECGFGEDTRIIQGFAVGQTIFIHVANSQNAAEVFQHCIVFLTVMRQ